MNVERDAEEMVRRAEYNVNKVWNAWRSEFPNYSAKEVLAMVAFQFAKRYLQLLEDVEQQRSYIADYEQELDRLLEIGGE